MCELMSSGFRVRRLCLVVWIPLLTACTQQDLVQHIEIVPDGTVTASVQACTTPSNAVQSRLKFVLVLDESGSNQRRFDLNNDNAPLPGTDPNGQRRYGSLLSFINAYPPDDRVYFSLIRFSTEASIVKRFTNSRGDFAAAVEDRYRNHEEYDRGYTNYEGALDSLTDLLRDDVDAARQQDAIVSSTYVIVWVSDGAPIVGRDASDVQDSEALLKKVKLLRLLTDESPQYVDAVLFNTGYYYAEPSDPNARDLLGQMAEVGLGVFFEFATGQQIDFKRFSVPTLVSAYAVRDVWITNAQTVWDRGVLKADTDGDGLSDELELAGPTHPRRVDSDGNGVGDGVEYFITGGEAPCRDPACAPEYAEMYSMECGAFQVEGEPVGTYADADGDLLNDCEEQLLKSDPRNADSNSDFVPDFMALRYGINISAQHALAEMDVDLDGLHDYDEIKRNTPRTTSNDDVVGLIEAKYTKTTLSKTTDEECFRYEVRDLVYLDEHDIIRAYILEAPTVKADKHMVRVAEQSIGRGVDFSESSFE